MLQIPLLPGEAVLTADLPVKDGTVSVNLPPGTPGLSWRSTLEQRPALSLTAPRTATWIEQWVLVPGTMWHVELGGIAPVHPGSPDGAHQPTWLPWPGESVSVKSSRPEGIGGATLTLDGGREEVRPGIRATEVSLDLVFRTSRGGQHTLGLPPGAARRRRRPDPPSPPALPREHHPFADGLDLHGAGSEARAGVEPGHSEAHQGARRGADHDV